MRRPSVFLQRRDRLEVAMTPMIDVVFLLLVFFVWTASFQIVEYALPGAVAQTSGAQDSLLQEPPPEADFDTVVIRIHSRGDATLWELNGQSVPDLPALQQRLQLIAAIRLETPVIVHPDPDVTAGEALDVYDAAKSLRFPQVAFATPQK